MRKEVAIQLSGIELVIWQDHQYRLVTKRVTMDLSQPTSKELKGRSRRIRS
jgi:hypothetical protein